MLMDIDLTRRAMMAGLPLAAGLAAAPALAAAAKPAKASPAISDAEAMARLADPATRARVRARVAGSCEAETVNIFYRLNIYGFTGENNLVPFYTLNHLSVNEWTPLSGNRYQAKTFECGVYCAFDTDEVLTEWKNPLTGEMRKPFQFLGGPFTVTHGPDGMVAMGAELSPRPMRMEAYGGMLFMGAMADMARPNPISPEKYPKFSSGPIAYWDTVSTTGASVAQAFDENVTSADAFHHFQNLGSWHPWMAMGARPGRTHGRAAGVKVRSLDQIPAAALKGLQDHTPEIFDRKAWTKPRFDTLEYIATQTG
jgi:hypothetical protein